MGDGNSFDLMGLGIIKVREIIKIIGRDRFKICLYKLGLFLNRSRQK